MEKRCIPAWLVILRGIFPYPFSGGHESFLRAPFSNKINISIHIPMLHIIAKTYAAAACLESRSERRLHFYAALGRLALTFLAVCCDMGKALGEVAGRRLVVDSGVLRYAVFLSMLPRWALGVCCLNFPLLCPPRSSVDKTSQAERLTNGFSYPITREKDTSSKMLACPLLIIRVLPSG